MRTSLDCVPCFTRQAVDLIRKVTQDPEEQNRLLARFLEEAGRMDFSLPPPVIAARMQELIRPFLEEEDLDPWLDEKERFTRLALNRFPVARQRVHDAKDPLLTAVKLAAAGNIIDLGVHAEISDDEVLNALEAGLELPLYGDVEAFRQAIAGARQILFLADNAGEIVFDKLLLELLPRERVVFAVRGAPVLNDATLADAEASGVADLVEVVENGSCAPGTILEDCSPEFRLLFSQSDLVIAKGQGNFETLLDTDKQIFFILKVKCDVVARHTGYPTGSLVLHCQRPNS